MNNVPPRSDSFYRFAVLSGLLLALFALAWGRHTLSQSRERLFALAEILIADRAAAELQRSETSRIEDYSSALERDISNKQPRSAARTAVLIGEARSTARRLDRARVELERRQALVVHKSQHAALLRRQMSMDASRADALVFVGFPLCVVGLLLWYIRRQRHLDAALQSEPHSDPQMAARDLGHELDGGPERPSALQEKSTS